jgi:hypothetical protein
LSFPAFAVHTVGGNKYCDCNTAGCVEDYPGECAKNYIPLTTKQNESPSDATAELGILVVALMFWLRLRA